MGTESINGERLHRVEIQPAPKIPAEMFGFTDPAFTDFDATLAFLAEDDGKPAGMVIEATWLQGADALEGAMDIQFRFDGGTRTVEVTAPDDPWKVRVGAEIGYQMAHPVDWTVEYFPATGEYFAGDDFLGPVDEEVQVVAYPDLQGAASAEEWFRWSAQTLIDEFGVEPSVSELTLTDELAVRVLTLYYEDGGDEIFFQQAVIVRGTQAWDINWYSLAGSEADDVVTLLRMLTTFEPEG